MHMKIQWARKTRPQLLTAVALILPLLLGTSSAVAAQPGGTDSGPAAQAAASPTVTGPVTGGNGAVVLQATAFDLGSVGYTRSEYLLSGTAESYVPEEPLDADGRWQVTPASSARTPPESW